MIDTLIRETSARWGLGDQGRPLVQMLVSYIANPATGGLNGFLDKFRKAGWGGMANSWLGHHSSPELPTTSQIENVLGGSGGILEQVVSRLGISRDKLLPAIASFLPALISRMTPGGTVPATLPSEFAALAREGSTLLGTGAAAATAAGARASTYAAAPPVAPVAPSSGIGRWLPWLIGALLVIFGLSYCSRDKDTVPVTSEAPATTAPATEPAVTPAPVPAVTPDPAPAVAPAPAPSEPAAPAATETFTAPDGAGVLDDMHNGMPVLRVFFDTGKTDVSAEFAEKSKSLIEFLKANPDVTAVVSGFNDPTGDAARNAELSKQRAQAVKSALEAAGLAADRAVLEKPADTTATGATNASSRRVDVMLRR